MGERGESGRGKLGNALNMIGKKVSLYKRNIFNLSEYNDKLGVLRFARRCQPTAWFLFATAVPRREQAGGSHYIKAALLSTGTVLPVHRSP